MKIASWFFCFCIVLLCSSNVFGQDLIVKMNGDEIKATVQEITLAEILYIPFTETDSLKKPDSVSNNVLKIARSEVFMIKYKNGTREVFSENLADETAKEEEEKPAEISSFEAMQKGENDAAKYYSPATATAASAASGALCGAIGIIPAGIIMATPPKIDNKSLPDQKLKDNEAYRKGYERKAHQMKIKQSIIGYGAGFLISVGLYVIMVVSGGY